MNAKNFDPRNTGIHFPHFLLHSEVRDRRELRAKLQLTCRSKSKRRVHPEMREALAFTPVRPKVPSKSPLFSILLK
jgi:hypothetical protein